MKLHKKILCISGIGILLAGTNLFAAEKSAQEIISKAYQYIGSMDKYAFDAVIMDDEVENGEITKKYRQDISVKLDKPGKLRIDSKAVIKNRSSYINNGSFTIYDRGFNYYGQLKTPKTIDGALDFIFEKYGIKAPLAQLLYSNMDKRFKFKKSKYFGVVDVAGVECDYVAFRTKAREVHIWVTTGDKPLVKSYSIINTNLKSNPRRNTTLVWKNSSNIVDSDFIFTVPKGVEKISINSAN